MIVPKYWSEAKEKRQMNGRQVTLHRWGWSDVDDNDAYQVARQRLAEAWQAFERGEEIAHRERKVRYNGAAGVPIREEILATHRDVVITRNSYGAQCLNTPDVLFVDVDVLPHPRLAGVVGWVVSCLFLAGASIIWMDKKYLFACVLALMPIAFITRQLWLFLRRLFQGDRVAFTRKKIRMIVESKRNWSVRVYRSPNGFRLLVMHDVFDFERSNQEEAFEFMRAVGADRVYMLMCKNQRCFRARTSPKPWRIGIVEQMSRAIWPHPAFSDPRRASWITAYETKSEGFAACRFEFEIGGGRVHEKTIFVRDLHDRLCRATSTLPLA